MGRDLAPATCMREENGAGPGPCHMHGGGHGGGRHSAPYVHTHSASGAADRRGSLLVTITGSPVLQPNGYDDSSLALCDDACACTKGSPSGHIGHMQTCAPSFIMSNV